MPPVVVAEIGKDNMKKTNRIVSRFAGILIFALSLTPGALAQERDAAPAVVAGGLMNVAVYDAFKSAGVDEGKARAAAKSLAIPDRDELATKSDLAELETRLVRAGAAALGMILTLMAGLFAMIVGIWRKIADLAEKMPPPVPAR